MIDAGAFENRLVEVDRQHVPDDQTRASHASQFDNAHDPALEVGRRLRHQWSRHMATGTGVRPAMANSSESAENEPEVTDMISTRCSDTMLTVNSPEASANEAVSFGRSR